MKAGRILPVALLALCLLVASGCSGGTAKVSGEVKLDDKPLEKGSILFTPAGGKGQPAGGEIKDGKYSVANVPVGSNRVEIRASKAGPKKKMYADDPKSEVETWNDVKFTTQSKMEVDIKAGDNPLPPFELKSSGK